MDNNALVSIIVPIYKTEQYLDDCIQSLLTQTYDNIEIILVNDGSPDRCPQMCDAWEQRDGRIKVIHKENGGLSDARNAGISIATGKYILFIDSDDAIPEHFVDNLIKASSQEDVLVVSSALRFRQELPSFYTQSVVNRCSKNLATIRGGMYVWGILYHRTIIESIRLLFDVSLRNLEDVTWNVIYLRYVSTVVHVDVPYFYRINPTSITSRCSDYLWQITSWIAARRSIMNWFANKSLNTQQQKEAVGMFRHCQNNIYAECLVGKISCATLNRLEGQREMQFCETLISPSERFVRRFFPRLYYVMYTSLLRAKRFFRTNKQQ